MGQINYDVQKRVVAAMDEMNDVLKERHEVIHGAWVGRIGQLHMILLGRAGSGKTMLSRNMVSHIDGAVRFDKTLDETSDPSEVFGPPDIKGMVEDGRTRRIPDGMLPEATDAFLDEFYNANKPLLHSIMSAMNERLWNNNGQPTPIPLRQVLAGTNKFDMDPDLAALHDRIHLRYVVDYVKDRQHKSDMVTQAIARMALKGRGTATDVATSRTMVTLDELDAAHKEALALDITDETLALYWDISDELDANGIEISNRREVEGMVAVMANAWLRGHEEVQPGDLDILAHMWWTLPDQMATSRGIILAATNPGEKAAFDLLEDLDGLKRELAQAEESDMDPARKRRVGVESVRNAEKLLKEAQAHMEKARAAGASTTRLQEVIGKAEAFKVQVGENVFGLKPSDMAAMTAANA
jgi:MoxR-like ATPase